MIQQYESSGIETFSKGLVSYYRSSRTELRCFTKRILTKVSGIGLSDCTIQTDADRQEIHAEVYACSEPAECIVKAFKKKEIDRSKELID